MRIRIAIALVVATAASQARAQAPADAPSSEPAADPAAAIWKAEAQAGLIMASGNSRSLTVAGGMKASRQAGKNKLSLEGAAAFARATLELVEDVNSSGTVDGPSEIASESRTTTNMYLVRARYDRFLTARNALFAAGSASGDRPAGKEFVGAGQAGYSLTILADDIHNLVGELGYDYSYEDFVAGDSVSIHSGRAALNYEGKIADESTVTLGGELLANLNQIEIGTRTADAGEDLRGNGKFALTTNVWKNINFRFSFTVRYDKFPAPKPPLSLPYGPLFSPVAERFDTLTEASLIIHFI
jgi:hypothetical protein